MPVKPIVAIMMAITVGACAQSQSLAIQTSSVPAGAKAEAVRGTPVVSGRPARVYIMAGFKEADCSPINPTLQVSQPPKKGTVTFKPGQTTTIQHSGSGKCMGAKLQGTGIYYTAAPGASGPDSFVISATTGTGAPTTRPSKSA
ncbi:MAG: hypothetical protein R3D67_16875 [Hyphomicrobiaceae bacterium]